METRTELNYLHDGIFSKIFNGEAKGMAELNAFAESIYLPNWESIKQDSVNDMGGHTLIKLKIN